MERHETRVSSRVLKVDVVAILVFKLIKDVAQKHANDE